MVWLARRRKDGQQVALKILHGDSDAIPQMRERFVQEAQLLASIRSPNVVRVLGAGQTEGHLFLAMEYLAGQDLSDLVIDRHPLSRPHALALCHGLTRGLRDIHARGVIHRDLKPANVIVPEDGQPRVADFGLAKGPVASGVRTKTGLILGTPGYLSPEQILGARPTPASDIYALGLVFYFVFAGQPAFLHDNIMEVMKMQRDGLDRDRLTLIPPDVARLVVSMIARTPEERPDAAGCLQLLEALPPDRVAPEPPTTAMPRVGGTAPADAGAPARTRVTDSTGIPGTRIDRRTPPAPGMPGPEGRGKELRPLHRGSVATRVSQTGPLISARPPGPGAGGPGASPRHPLLLVLPSLLATALVAGFLLWPADPPPSPPVVAPPATPEADRGPLTLMRVRRLEAARFGAPLQQALNDAKRDLDLFEVLGRVRKHAEQEDARRALRDRVLSADWIQDLEVIREHATASWWRELPRNEEARAAALELRRRLATALLRLRLFNTAYQAMHPPDEVPAGEAVLEGLDEVLSPVVRLRRRAGFAEMPTRIPESRPVHTTCRVLVGEDMEEMEGITDMVKMLAGNLAVCEGVVDPDLTSTLRRYLPDELPADRQGFVHLHLGLYDLFPRVYLQIAWMASGSRPLLTVPLHPVRREPTFLSTAMLFSSGRGAAPVTWDLLVHRSLLDGDAEGLRLDVMPLDPDDFSPNSELRCLVAGISVSDGRH